MAHVTAAALASELKTLAHPASVDTIPTSAGKEDHVSMSMAAALKAGRAVDLARSVVAIELLCAAQGLDLLAPLRSSPPLARRPCAACVPPCRRSSTIVRRRPTSRAIASLIASRRSRGDDSRAKSRKKLIDGR